MLHTRTITDIDELDRYADDWDRLAVSLNEPYCSPAWMLAWWKHLQLRHARLHVVVVTSETRLVGVAPLVAERPIAGFWRFRILGSGTSGSVNLLAEPGLETVVAAEMAKALSTSRPRVQALLFEGIPDESPWPELLQKHWPQRAEPIRRDEFSLPEPVVRLDEETFDDWFAAKSANFRQQFRRRIRQLESAGASFQVLTNEESIRGSIQEFADLHRRRWASRGGSAVMRPGIENMLAAAAETLGTETGRFRLWTLNDPANRPVASMLFLNAGDTTSWWLGGFDDSWARYQPALVTMLIAIRDAVSRGDTRLSLGPGGQQMKYRFADAERYLEWVTLVPRRRDLPMARLQLLRPRTRIVVSRAVPERLKRIVRRIESAFRGRLQRG